jgi:hypothetical protein
MDANTMNYLFIGGIYDGQVIDVPPHMSVWHVVEWSPSNVALDSSETGIDTNLKYRQHQYHRTTLAGKNGPVDVFTIGSDCPIESLIKNYNTKNNTRFQKAKLALLRILRAADVSRQFNPSMQHISDLAARELHDTHDD